MLTLFKKIFDDFTVNMEKKDNFSMFHKTDAGSSSAVTLFH